MDIPINVYNKWCQIRISSFSITAEGDHFLPWGVFQPYLVFGKNVIVIQCHFLTVSQSNRSHFFTPAGPDDGSFISSTTTSLSILLKKIIYHLCYANSRFCLSLSLTWYHFQQRGNWHLYFPSHWVNQHIVFSTSTWGEELMPMLNMTLHLFYE